MIQVTEDSLFHYCRGGYEFCLAYLRKYGFLLYPISKGKLGDIDVGGPSVYLLLSLVK